MSSTPAIQPLSLERHKGMGWQRFSQYGFARGATVVSLAAAEVVKAALSLPLGFVRQGDGWHLVAVLGLPPSPNLFVGPDGRWLGSYIPASLRSHPFRIVQAEGGNAMLGIDEASGLLVTSGGEAFFDAENQPSEAVRGIWSFLLEVAKGEAQLAGACNKLDGAGLLEPWPITFKKGEGLQKVDGLYRVSEPKLGALGPEAFLDLRSAGILPLAYAQMFSTGHLERLVEGAEAHARFEATETERQKNAKPEANPMMGFTFGHSIDVDWSKLG
jgi:hypothetical protein